MKTESKAPKPRINVMHFICSTGFYGAEKWILALANNCDPVLVSSELVVTREWESHDLTLTTEFRNLGLTAHELKMAGRFDMRVIRSLVALLKDRKIDVLHSHGYKSDILGVIAARMAGIVCISTPHGFEKTDDWKLNLFIELGNRSLKRFDKVVPLSLALCKDIRKIGVSESKMQYIRNGVDLKGVMYRSPSEQDQRRGDVSRMLHGSQKTIGFIGQMIGRKNVIDLLDVFEQIANDTDDVRLVLLGDGDARAEYQAHARKLACSDRIDFLGFVDNPLEYLQCLDLFVMTSTLEGIPRCLMESMAMGVPVAAYDIPGIDQLVEHNVTGLLAPLGDKQALEQCWRHILTDHALADRLSKSAADLIERDYAAARMAQEYTQLYGQLLNVS